MNENIIVMKVGPHSGMTLNEIIDSKKEEEKIHQIHFWGYSGVFCQPKKVQEFCKNNKNVKLILIETKSSYNSKIGFIKSYSVDNKTYEYFIKPVQLQGASFSFVCKNIKEIDNFCLDNYLVVGGKNDSKNLKDHLKFRVNKSFAKLYKNDSKRYMKALEVDLVYPYAIWIKDDK